MSLEAKIDQLIALQARANELLALAEKQAPARTALPLPQSVHAERNGDGSYTVRLRPHPGTQLYLVFEEHLTGFPRNAIKFTDSGMDRIRVGSITEFSR